MAHSVEVNISNHPLSREENGIVFVVADGEGQVRRADREQGRACAGVRADKHQPHFMTWAEFDRSMRVARKG